MFHYKKDTPDVLAISTIEKFLHTYSVWFVPALLLLLTCAMFFYKGEAAQAIEGKQLAFNLVEDTANNLATPQQAYTALLPNKAVTTAGTHLSEAPFWLLIHMKNAAKEIASSVTTTNSSISTLAQQQSSGLPDDQVIEFTSRHATELSCWSTDGFEIIGSTANTSIQNSPDGTNLLSKTNATFALLMPQKKGISDIICKSRYVGPAKVGVIQWDKEVYQKKIIASAKHNGLLEGGLGILAAFVLVMGILNKETLYLVFFSWIIINMRSAAISSGWDLNWLGLSIPSEWLLMTRKITIMSYHITFIVFFGVLFKQWLPKLGNLVYLRINQWLCLPLLIAAILLPYRNFLPLLWLLAAYNAATLFYYTIKLMKVAPNRTVMWYTASFAVTILTAVYEIINAVFATSIAQLPFKLYPANTAAAVLVSSFLAALAIAEKLRQAKISETRAINDLGQTYAHSPVGLFTCDENLQLLRTNQAFAEKMGPYTHSHWHEAFNADAWSSVTEKLRSDQKVEMEICREMHGAQEKNEQWFLIRMSVFADKIEGSLQDITTRIAASKKLAFIAKHDSLTGAFNRLGITEVLASLRPKVVGGKPVTVVYFDVDRFKVINDLYGQKAGDGVLKELHKRMLKRLQKHNAIGRLSAAEFLLIINNTTFEEASTLCSNLLADIINIPFNVLDKSFRIKASMGMVELWPELSDNDALSAADDACRKGLQSGRFNIVKYNKDSPVFKERALNRLLLEKLESGEVPDGLFLVMQPIMSVKNPYGSLNFEVLLRKQQEDGSVASAWSIISTAEKNGRIALIDRWVLSTALAWIDTHYDHLIKKTKFICINLSGGSLNDERFTEDAFAMLATYPRAAKLVCLEVTESVAINDLNNIQRFIETAKEFGACIAIDDFGAGFSSFSYLKELPANVLKIDGSFVKGAATNLGDMAIVAAISGLAASFAMQCVAEWTEDLPTIKAMAELEVDYMQGFALAKPMLPEEILKASSAADFITDPATKEFVKLLANNNAAPSSLQ